MCPFTERGRLALAAKGIPFQEVEIDLENKTPWHVEINGGLVPVVETPSGRTLIESRVIMDYIENAFPDKGIKLYSDDYEVKAMQHIAMKKIDDYMAQFYGLIRH